MSATETRTIIPAGTWVIDPVHTSIGFQVTDTTEGFSTASGRFIERMNRLPSVRSWLRTAQR